MSYTQLFVLAIMFATACAPAGADPAIGSSELREVGDFHGIDVAGTIEVEARIDRATRVEVFAERADLLAKVTTSLTDGVLVIDTRGKLDRARRLRVVVTVPRLDTLSISGTGTLRVTGLAAESIDATIAGTGALQLAGTARALKLAIPGTGEVRAKDLITSSTVIDVRGTAEASVHATRSVDVRLSGTGAIRVYGRPPMVKKSIHGTGVVDLR